MGISLSKVETLGHAFEIIIPIDLEDHMCVYRHQACRDARLFPLN